jgi:hypothetical protein
LSARHAKLSKAPRHFAGAGMAGQARNEGMLTNSFMASVRRARGAAV